MSATLTFDTDRYLRIQQAAVGSAAALAAAVDSLGDRLRNVFFLGAGGAGILMAPAALLLGSRSSVPCYHWVGAELMAHGSQHLGEGSLVVIPSLSGTTPDALDHLRFAKAAGATIVALVGHEGTPVGDEADAVVVVPAADDTSSESFFLQSLILSLTVMNRRGEYPDLEGALGQLAGVPAALLAAKLAFEDTAAELGGRIAGKDFHIFTGAGPSWTEAYYFAMCILEEMQWIRTRPVQASDFFHGTLELVEPGVSVVLLKGEGASRAQAERVAAFSAEHTDDLIVLDSAAVPLPGVSDDLRALLAPVVHAALLERVSCHVAELRDHPLTTRRYYRRVAY